MPHGSILGFVGHMVSAATIDNTYKENVCAPLKLSLMTEVCQYNVESSLNALAGGI